MPAPPAGFIPHQFREEVYRPLTADEIAMIRESYSAIDEHGRKVHTSDAEIRVLFKHCIGVIDTRTGECHPVDGNMIEVTIL